METLHGGRLPHVAHVHSDLGAAAEGLGVEEQYDGGFKLAADGRVHPGTDQHHPLQQPIRCQDMATSLQSPPETHGGLRGQSQDLPWGGGVVVTNLRGRHHRPL